MVKLVERESSKKVTVKGEVVGYVKIKKHFIFPRTLHYMVVNINSSQTLVLGPMTLKQLNSYPIGTQVGIEFVKE